MSSEIASTRVKSFVKLHLLMFIFSLSALFLKLASAYLPGADKYTGNLLTWEIVLYFGLGFLMLGVYAIFFQQILKHMKLTTAYSNKAVVIVWALLWDLLVFKESVITWGKLAGFIIIIAGICLMVNDDG